MWRCANCRTVCRDEVCGRCGMSLEESRELGAKLGLDINGEEFLEEAVYKPKAKIRAEKRAAKEAVKREKRIARLEEQLDKAKLKDEQIPSVEKLTKLVKKLKIAAIALLATLVAVSGAFIITGVYQGSQLSLLRTQIADAKDTNGGIQSENEALSSANDEMSGEIEALNAEVDRLNSRVEMLTEENNILRPKADFLDDHIKVVEDDSKKTYHTFGCEHLDLESFWAYNSEQVVGKSKYTKCPYCN